MNRRRFLSNAALAAVAAGHQLAAQSGGNSPKMDPDLPLRQFEPRSALTAKRTPIDRARFPVIDFHTHLCWSTKSEAGVPLEEARVYLAPPAELLQVMDRKNLRMLVNVTGGMGSGLRDCVQRYDRAHPGRFLTFTEPWYAKAAEANYAKFQGDEIVRAHKDGARGLKLLKTLGLYLREDVTKGKLIRVDDRRFDPMWEACAAMKMPVAIHVADPVAFFDPIDRHNERFEELANHPDWSFYGADFPPRREILEARNRVMARHPKTQFVGLHVGNSSENLEYAAECFDKYPNFSVDIAARIGELGRQPRASRQFFERYQDRIVFGTDATPHGDEFPQQLFNDELYEIYFRFLETTDEYFPYAPAKIPPQGRWNIYGVGLPETILRKVYFENASRLLGLPL